MLPEDRVCTLSFDEMSIKANFQYNEELDLIEGCEDLGFLGRKGKEAHHALVFMVQGLRANWKQPLLLFLSHKPTKSGVLKPLLLATIKVLFEIGLDVCSIVCDQGPPNQALFRNLGITEEKPYFYFEGREIAGHFDAPHLFKSARTTFFGMGLPSMGTLSNGRTLKQFTKLTERATPGLCRS